MRREEGKEGGGGDGHPDSVVHSRGEEDSLRGGWGGGGWGRGGVG